MATTTKARLTERQLAFLDENPFVGVVTTLRRDGSPHSTVVWVDVLDRLPSFNTARGRAKERNMGRDPRVSLLVVDPQNVYRWLAVDGRVELTEEDADAQIDKLAKKYLGKDRYPGRRPDETRVRVVVTPERVDAHGLDE
jgi:PPOX class probable F420-dependent enzyme